VEIKLRKTVVEFIEEFILIKSPKKEYDYDHYKIPLAQFIFLWALGALGVFAGSWIFYRFLPVSVLLAPLGIFLPISRSKSEVVKVRHNLRADFGELLGSLADSLRTGMSFERAIVTARSELEKTEEGRRKRLKLELDLIIESARASIPISQGFANFGKRSRVDEIEIFAVVLPITLRKGGDLIGLMKKTSELIKERSRINSEIEVILAEKKMEKRIVDLAPFLMLYMLSTTSPDFMEPVFTTFAGRMAMTVALLLFLGGWFISGKIMKIEV